MLKYTYIIEYNLVCNTNQEKKTIYYSSNFELTDFVIAKKDIKQAEENKWKFLRHLIYGRILYNHSIYECYTYGGDFQLEIKILKQYNNRCYRNRFITPVLEEKLTFINRGCFLLYGIDNNNFTPDFLKDRYKQFIKEIDIFHNAINFEASINYILIIAQNCILNNKRIQALDFSIKSLLELKDILNIGDYEKIKSIENTSENLENGKFEIRYKTSRYVRDLIVSIDKLMKLFDIKINKGKFFSVDYLNNAIKALILQINNEKELYKTDNILPEFVGDEMILKGHYKFIRDNERYLLNYLNELYDEFKIKDCKQCNQKTLGGICAVIYESKVITHCNTFSECMRLLCAYWQRELPKDCRLNKYQESKQELLDKHRILNEIPQK